MIHFANLRCLQLSCQLPLPFVSSILKPETTSIVRTQLERNERKVAHQILTCVSVSRSDAARPARSEELRYLLGSEND